MSDPNANDPRRPEELANDIVRRDAEWEQWETEIVQLIVDQLYPSLIANYPGKGWFCIKLNGQGIAFAMDGLKSAFGEEMKRLYAAVNAAYNPHGWQMRGTYASNSYIYFNFRPLTESGRLFGFLSPVDATDTIDLQAPTLPAHPSHARPNRRGLTCAVSSVVLKPGKSGSSSTEPFIYEHFC